MSCWMWWMRVDAWWYTRGYQKSLDLHLHADDLPSPSSNPQPPTRLLQTSQREGTDLQDKAWSIRQVLSIVSIVLVLPKPKLVFSIRLTSNHSAIPTVLFLSNNMLRLMMFTNEPTSMGENSGVERWCQLRLIWFKIMSDGWWFSHQLSSPSAVAQRPWLLQSFWSWEIPSLFLASES